MLGRIITDAPGEPSSADIAKVPLSFRGGKNIKLLSTGGVVESLSLIIKEEEQFVLHNRAADSTAEHVPAQLVSRSSVKSIFPRVRVEFVIPEIFPEVTVETVRAGLNGGTNDSALKIPEFSRSILRNQVKFLNSIWSRCIPEQVI